MGHDVVWGLDLLAGSLEVKLEDFAYYTGDGGGKEGNTQAGQIPSLKELSPDMVRQILLRFDIELSALEEELDYADYCRRAGKENQRSAQAEIAAQRKTDINTAGSLYMQLLERSAELAETPLEKRAVELRRQSALFQQFATHPEIESIKTKITKAYREKRFCIEGIGEVTLGSMGGFWTNPDAKIRKKMYEALVGAEDIEALVLKEIRTLNSLIQKEATAPDAPTNFFDVRTMYCEVPNAQTLSQMLRKFVAETKCIYDTLFRELISDDPIQPWDKQYVAAPKNPFTRLSIPKDSQELFGIGLTFLKGMGYDPQLIDRLFNPASPGAYIDIEKRNGKDPGAVTYSLGPFSHGKNILLFNPETYEPHARPRWITLPHEFAHGIHYEMSRKAAARSGAIFFTENTVANETVTKFHEVAALEPEFLDAYLTTDGVDRKLLARWNTFLTLAGIYNNIRLTLGEIGLHQDPDHAREAFYKAYILTKPSAVQETPSDCSAEWSLTPAMFRTPASVFAYVLGEMYAIALAQTARQRFGSVFSPQAGQFLTDNIMTGSITPIHERVVKATGTNDFVGNAIGYFNQSAKK